MAAGGTRPPRCSVTAATGSAPAARAARSAAPSWRGRVVVPAIAARATVAASMAQSAAPASSLNTPLEMIWRIVRSVLAGSWPSK